jgi:protein-tyrosine kinase
MSLERRRVDLKRKNTKVARGSLMTLENRNKQGLEQFRSLRSNIHFSSIDKHIQTIAVSSARSGDGKTMTASNLAVVFSQEGKRVLLVDADLRKPSIHHVFRLENRYGLSNYLIGQKGLEDIIQNAYPNLDIITSGIIPPNPPELLGSMQMGNFIQEMKETYDVIILDTPPVLIVTDPTLIASKCDGVLLVVRAKKSELKEVKKAQEQLRFAGATMIGAVLNGKKQPKGSYYYQ